MRTNQANSILVLAFSLGCLGCQKRPSPYSDPGTTIGDASQYMQLRPRERPLDLVYSVEFVVQKDPEDRPGKSWCYILLNVVTDGAEDLVKTSVVKFGSKELRVSQAHIKREETGRIDQALRVDLKQDEVDGVLSASKGLVSFGGESAVAFPSIHLDKIRSAWREVREGKRETFTYVVPRSAMTENE